MYANTSRQLLTVSDQLLDVPEGDYPEVAHEVIQYVRTHMDKFQDDLHEFLDLRQSAAPTTVDRAHVLDSILGHETRRWLQHYER